MCIYKIIKVIEKKYLRSWILSFNAYVLSYMFFIIHLNFMSIKHSCKKKMSSKISNKIFGFLRSPSC